MTARKGTPQHYLVNEHMQKEALSKTAQSVKLAARHRRGNPIRCLETGEVATLRQWASAFAICHGVLYETAYSAVNNCVHYGGSWRGLQFRRVRPRDAAARNNARSRTAQRKTKGGAK
jgi:hypothetical protein